MPRRLVHLGCIAHVRLTAKGQHLTAKAYMPTPEIRDLLAFFHSPEFDHLCEAVLRIPIDPVAGRERVGVPCFTKIYS